MERHQKILYGLGTGVIIGAAARLLLAPKTGKETRKSWPTERGLSGAAVRLRQAMKRRNSHRMEAAPDYQVEVSN